MPSRAVPTHAGRLSREELRLLRHLRHIGPLCRDDLVSLLSTTRQTGARLIAGMVAKGWVREAGVGESSGGRRPVLWHVAERAAFSAALAVEVGGMRAAVADLQGDVLAEERRPFEITAGPDVFLGEAAGILEGVLLRAGVSPEQLLGVGVTAPGVLNREEGRFGFCAYYRDVTWWEGFPILDKLRERVETRFLLDYHSNACVLAEHWFGIHRGTPNMIFIAIEMQGIGAGILINGEIYRGAGGAAGEFGHMTIEQNGRLCRCGSRGCIEAYVSGTELARRAQEIRRAGGHSAIFDLLDDTRVPTVQTIVEAAAGDRIARGIVEEAGQVLGVGVANLVNLLNPGLVVFGGELARAGEVLLRVVEAVVSRRALEKPAKEARFVCASDSSDGKLRGMIAMVLHEMFGSPCRVQSPKRGRGLRGAPDPARRRGNHGKEET